MNYIVESILSIVLHHIAWYFILTINLWFLLILIPLLSMGIKILTCKPQLRILELMNAPCMVFKYYISLEIVECYYIQLEAIASARNDKTKGWTTTTTTRSNTSNSSLIRTSINLLRKIILFHLYPSKYARDCTYFINVIKNQNPKFLSLFRIWPNSIYKLRF